MARDGNVEMATNLPPGVCTTEQPDVGIVVL